MLTIPPFPVRLEIVPEHVLVVAGAQGPHLAVGGMDMG